MSQVASEDQGPSRIRDELLVVRCQLGETEAFDELIGRWHTPLWRYVRRMSARDDEAQDLLQDIWLRVIRGIGRVREGARFRGWLFGIARRAVMDRYRQQYGKPPTEEVDAERIAAESDAPDGEAALEALERALETLPLVEREVLTLFYLQDLSLVEIADVLTLPVGTVKSRLFRARQLMRQMMRATMEKEAQS